MSVIDFSYFGEILSLATAIIWAISVIFFKKCGESVHPLALNTFKNLLATTLFLPTMYLFGVSLKQPIPVSHYVIMAASGAIGIGVADTIFFMSLNRLGAGLSSIVDCLYSPFIIILSVFYLNEQLSLVQFLGVILILGAVLLISRGYKSGTISRRNLFWGIFYGVLSMFLMAVGIVFIKPLLEQSPLLWVTEVRLLGGTVAGLIALLLIPSRQRIIRSLLVSKDWKYILPGAFIGAYVAMVFWLGGMKYTQASISSALNQTSNIFIFVFAVLLLKEPVNRRRIAGLIIAVSGVLLVTFG